MNRANLEDWSIIGSPSGAYTSPEKATYYLMGKVYDHPKHGDGKSIMTSVVMHADGKEVLTMNTKYTLGKVNETYRKWYSKQFEKDLDENHPFS